MRNRTGLVALVVLAAATLLMVFFVLPNMNGKKPAETPADTAAGTVAGEEAATKTADGKQGRAAPEDGATVSEPAAEGAETPAATAGAEVAVEGEATPEAAAGEATAEATTAEATTAEATPAAGEAATAETAQADAAASWVVPAFDLLRVEPDGSTVIAGRAEPNTKIEIRNGDTVIATAEAGPSGDFAAVFDQPLAAGDYQLTLNASDGKGASKGSEEVATVSVPKDAGGELLAMVSKPGEASRLITLPETAASGEAAQQTPAETPAETALAQPEGEPAALSGEAASTTPAAEGAATTQTPAADTTAADKAQVRVAAVELEGERMFVAGNARPGALVRIYADDKLVGEAKADEEGRYVVDGRIDLAVGRHAIRADVMSADGARVELRASVPFDRPEGEQIAVVAQDDTAAAQATPALGLVGGGTFDKLRAEATKALSLLKGLFADGRVPSAEQLAAARSATEIALKSLAEFKPGAEEGEVARQMAARASSAAADALARLQALPKEAADVGAALGSIETAVAAALAPAIETTDGAASAVTAAASASIGDLAAAAADLRTRFAALFAGGRNATAAEIGTARTALETALRGLAGFTPPADAGADAVALAGRLKAWAAAALGRFAAVPADAGAEAYGEALAALDAMPTPAAEGGATAGASVGAGAAQTTAEGAGAATGAEPAQTPAVAEDAATESETATPAGEPQAEGTAAESQQPVAEEPQTVEQAPLQASKTSVIIRRGDTLWQISRRIYGKGVRYTTIYLANQDQIADPDRILPGQIFGVPAEAVGSDAEAEAEHRKHVHDD